MRGDIEVFTDAFLDAPSGIIGVGDEIWFTSIGNGRLGRVVAGRVETFVDPNGSVRLPANIFPGADGRVWFTSLGSNRVGVIDPRPVDPADTIQTFDAAGLVQPVALKAAPDGRFWLTLRGSDAVASFDPRDDEPMAGLRVVTADSISQPSALFVLPDGRVWWVNAGAATIGCLDPGSGAVSTLGPWPDLGAPRAWAIGADGAIWVSTQARPGLLRLDPADGASAWFTNAGLRTPDGVWCASDGAVWVCDTEAGRLVRFDPEAADWSSYGEGAVAGPFDIKAGEPTDSHLWFTDKVGNAVGRVET